MTIKTQKPMCKWKWQDIKNCKANKTHCSLKSQITFDDLRLQNLGWLYLKHEISRSMFNSKVIYLSLPMVTRMWTHDESKTLDN
jgi:spore cortex formation protein SpoVR/YcgB (stage V sporulation)